MSSIARGVLASFCLVVTAADNDERKLQAYGGCPMWDNTSFSDEPSPFGWPLSPNDWSFAEEGEWPHHYLACGGVRQSPVNIPLHGDTCGINRIGEPDGALKDATRYKVVSYAKVEASHYMRTVKVMDDFGTLTLKDESGNDVVYEAISAQLTAPSMHTVDGKHYAAELLVLHKPMGARDMLQEGVILSVMFDDTNGTESPLFTHFGFAPDGQGHSPSKTWAAPHYIDVAQEIKEVVKGPSYQYDGSQPVPPCHENIKYLVLGNAIPVLPAQALALEETLKCWAGGKLKRPPVKGECREIRKDTTTLGGPHFAATCEAAEAAGTSYRLAACWDLGLAEDEAASCVKSPIDLNQEMASTKESTKPTFNFASIKHARVEPSNFSLDVIPLEVGAPGPLPNFGTIMILGKKYMVRKVSVRPLSSHTYEGKRHVGEIIIEALVFGDEISTQAAMIFGQAAKEGHSNGHSNSHRRLKYAQNKDNTYGDDELHRVFISVPIKFGVESALLRQIGLPFQAYKEAIKDRHPYHIESTIDLQGGIQEALNGKWLFYSGGAVDPTCPKWGVRWLALTTPITASLTQINYLQLPVTGMDSVRFPGITLNRQEYAEQVYLDGLPMWALSWHKTCDPNAHWTYDDVHCWDVMYPTCKEGTRQSPINILTDQVEKVGNSDFLSRVDWKPVSGLKVANNGHSLQITNDMFGYIRLTGEDGFPDFYDIAQFHLHMPSEHLIDGRQFSAELHVVHTRQVAVGQEKNTYDSFPLVVLGFMFDIGEEESPFLKQFYLGQETIPNNTFKTTKHPVDLMRSFGPALNGDFYRYDGSFTTPDCHEQIKWFVFDHVFKMSLAQWETFKVEFPFAHFNRPVNKIQEHHVVKNDFKEGVEAKYDFFLGRNVGRNRLLPGEGYILFPVVASLVVMVCIMLAVFVREGRSKLESAGGLTETIGRVTYNRA
ncbi:Carbonic anhydrase 14 (Carbonate dehydratase XIV) (Carbonic anhydrase XIV) (CA-XIV) [Durusdinium trenchii]|uniref:Carbonic anhydrase n=1 Tax=Durusdinium trenchii TaxID=1381693 RepID=A0ABP0JLK3_9DINO